MRKTIFFIACLLGLIFTFSSCKKKEVTQAIANPVPMEERSIQQSKGKDCDVPDLNKRKDCAQVDITVPKIKSGGSALGKAVDAWVDMYLLHQINWAIASEDGSEPKTVEAGIQRFFTTHDENAGSVASGQYALTCTYEELLNDGKYLTLMLNGYAFTGGNRVLEDVAIASFDVKTGKQLTWDDLVKDQKALIPIAQAKVQEKRSDAFKEGFTFDKEEPFALPLAFGLLSDGILLQYNPGEIYQLGGTTQFTVYFNELGNNLKVAAPAAPKESATSETDLGIYEVEGNDLIIPTFEIEVNNSAKASKTLAGKKETIIVSAFFWGVPTDPKELAKGEDGAVVFVDKQIELTGDNKIARFEGLKFNKALLSKVVDKDISLNVNVFSGRKSSEDNLLSCAILEKTASQVAGKRFVLGCKLIEEPEKGGPDLTRPSACFALPPADAAPESALNFLVNCDSVGNISFAEQPMKDIDALKAALRPLLKDHIKANPKALPGIETEGCLMGNSGAIRDMYEELKAELGVKAKPAEMEKADGKIAKEQPKEQKEATKAEKSSKPATTVKPAAKPANESAKTTTKSTTKPATANSASPAVTLKQNGDMLLNGKAVGSFEELRKQLQAALLAQATIPDKVELKIVGETGMGARAEVNSIIDESIKGAKWVRKKAAIAALNTAVGKKLGASTQLELGTYQTSGNFAYISAKPKQADGKAIDYSKTSYAKEAAAGKHADNAIGLLQYDKGAWKVLNYSLGLTKAPVDAWVKNYKAPKALFGGTK